MNNFEIDVMPCTSEQRKIGWSERFSLNGTDYPASWEISPTNDIYSLGSVYAEIVPVYVIDDMKHSLHWWVKIVENKTNLGSSLFSSSENEWSRVNSIKDIDALLNSWSWSSTCLANFNIQKNSMFEAEKAWSLDFSNTSKVIVPSSSLWMDVGMNKYKPEILLGDDVKHYVRLSSQKIKDQSNLCLEDSNTNDDDYKSRSVFVARR